MKRIIFSNGRQVCVLGQGTWNMGRNPLKRKEEAAALLTGIDLGMNMIDTAEMYNNEAFVGKTVKGVRDRVFLVSKVHPANASYPGTIRACEKSLRKLGTDYLDLYLLHWKSHFPLWETVDAMNELQRSGKIGLWGVSNIDLPQMKEMLTLPGGTACDADQVLYNLLDRGVEYDLIPWAQQYEMFIIAYSPLGEGPLLNHPVLKRIAWKHDATAAQIALAWTIRQPGVMAIPKAATAGHVRDNFKSLSIALDTEDLKELDAAFPPPTRKIPLAGW